VILRDFERFLLRVSGVKETTKNQYTRYVQRFLRERFANFSEEQLSDFN